MKIILRTFYGLLFLTTPLLGEQADFPRLTFSLAKWEIAQLQDIHGFGLKFYPNEAARVKIAAIQAKRAPVTPRQWHYQSQSPAEVEVAVIDNFTDSMVNHLGGLTYASTERPSEGHAQISSEPAGSALKFQFASRKRGPVDLHIDLHPSKSSPAHVRLLDAGQYSHLTLRVKGQQGGERLQTRLYDWENLTTRRPAELGELGHYLPGGRITQKWQTAWIPLDSVRGADLSRLARLTLRTRDSGGQVLLRDLALTTRRGAAIPVAPIAPSRQLRRAFWLWKTRQFEEPEARLRLLDFCRQQGVTDLFMQVRFEGEGADLRVAGAWLSDLVSQLHDAGVLIHALDGDPHYALTSKHPRVMNKLEAILRYNETADPDARFDGVRYDIEPYLLDEYEDQRESVLRQYLELVKKIVARTKGTGVVVGADVPFWFDSFDKAGYPSHGVGDRPMIDLLLELVDNIGIMDYRTEAFGSNGTIAHALAELRYAEEHGKQVFVGLETTRLKDETRFLFSRQERPGEPFLVLHHERDGVVTVDYFSGGQPAPTLDDNRLVLYRSRIQRILASGQTFYDRSLEELQSVIRETEHALRRFPSFAGIALHYYGSYQRMLSAQPVIAVGEN